MNMTVPAEDGKQHVCSFNKELTHDSICFYLSLIFIPAIGEAGEDPLAVLKRPTC